MNIVTTKKDALWSYAGQACRLGINFAIIPMLLVYLNEDEVGLWYVFMSFTSFTSLLQLGFSPALARNIAYCYSGARGVIRKGAVEADANGDVDWRLFSNLILLSKRFYRVIAAVAFVLLASLGSVYVFFITANTTASAALPWSVFCISMFLNLYFTYYESLLRGIGEIAGVNKSMIVSVCAQLIVCFVLSACGFGLLAPVLGYAVQGIAFRSACSRFFWRNANIASNISPSSYKQHRDNQYQKELYRTLSPNAYRDGWVSLATYLMSQSNTLICSAYLSLSEAGTYSLTVQIVNAVANFASVLTNAYHPSIQAAYVRKDMNRMRSLVSRSFVSYLLIYAIGCIGVYVVITPLLSIIRPDSVLDGYYMVVVFIYYFLYKNQSNFAAYISDTNAVPYTAPFVISSIVGTGLTVVLVSAVGMGMWGLILGQLLAQAVYNNWAWVRYVCRMLEISLSSLTRMGLSYWISLLTGKRKINANA